MSLAVAIDWCRCDEREGDNPACRRHTSLGEIAYACSVCGKGAFDRPGSVCAECQEPEAA
jgi:hypothetical protein